MANRRGPNDETYYRQGRGRARIDKLYVGTFERSSRFEAHLDPTGIALILERPGADDVHKSIHMHLNFGLFADILRELAATVGRIPKDDVMHSARESGR
jgi:hypothetical protein